jgi:FixJ family two-component response regulator
MLGGWVAERVVSAVATVVHVVDDDESFRNSIARLLRIVGYEVTLYKSAQALLDQLPDDGRSGCILLDVQIPGLSGPELQSRLTDIGYALPIVFLTGSSEAIEAEDFLIKPVPKQRLIDAIERAVRRHRARARNVDDNAIGMLGHTTPLH